MNPLKQKKTKRKKDNSSSDRAKKHKHIVDDHTDPNSRSYEQRRALRRIRAYPRKDVLIQGYAGTGKSYLINLLRTLFPRDKNGKREIKIILTAITGKAADLIKGNTTHRFLKQDKMYGDGWILVIDEVSMMDTKLFDKVWKWREDHYKSGYGFVRIVLVGDVTQLPPVEGDPFYASPRIKAELANDRMISVVLKRQQRVKKDAKDDTYDKFIASVRNREWNDNVAEIFRGHYDKCDQDGIRKLYVCGTRDAVHKLNMKMLSEKIPEMFHHTIKGVTFGINAPVMVTENINVDNELVAHNGMMGRVTEVDEDNKWVKIVRDQTFEIVKIPIVKHAAHIHGNSRSVLPIELAYAITVHKLQGTTMKNVILSVDFDNVHFWEMEQLIVLVTRNEELKFLDMKCTKINKIKHLFEQRPSKVREAFLRYIDEVQEKQAARFHKLTSWSHLK